MKIYFLVLSLVILFFSCSHKEEKIPVLSQNKMREVMWDLIRADQYVGDFLLKDSTKKRKPESIKLYEEIFQIHKISREQFKNSLDYYTSRPELLGPILDSLAKKKDNTPPYYFHNNPPVHDSVHNPFIPKSLPKS